MKMLILYWLKEAFRQLPMEQQLALSEAHTTFVEKYRKKGDIEAAYLMPFQGGKGMLIWEFESPEVADALTMEMPLYPWMNFEVYLLSSLDTHNNNWKEMFKRLVKDDPRFKK